MIGTQPSTLVTNQLHPFLSSFSEVTQINELQVPDCEKYEDEAEFWDKLDTADFMEEDDEWFHFEIARPAASELSLPDIIRVNL